MRTYAGEHTVSCRGDGTMTFTCCQCRQPITVTMGRTLRVPVGTTGFDYCCLDCGPRRIDASRAEAFVPSPAQVSVAVTATPSQVEVVVGTGCEERQHVRLLVEEPAVAMLVTTTPLQQDAATVPVAIHAPPIIVDESVVAKPR